MAKVYKMDPIHFRYSYSDNETLERFIEWIKRIWGNSICIIAHEEADSQVPRDHIHMCLYTTFNKKSFTDLFRKNFPTEKGNKRFGCFDDIIAPLDLERYVCKGLETVLPKILYTTYSENHIEERHKEFWEKNKMLKEKGFDRPKKEKKEKQVSFLQQCKKEYESQFVDKSVKNSPEDKYHIMKFITKRCGQEVKALDEFVVKRLTNGLHNSLIKCSLERIDFDEQMFKKAFPMESDNLEQYGYME